MDESSEIGRELLICTFKYFLFPLEAKGYKQKIFLPSDSRVTFELKYYGSFEIIITRDFQCQVEIVCLPQKGALEVPRKKTHLSPIIFLLSGNQVYLGSKINDIGCYYKDYEGNVKDICKQFFNYYNEIEKRLSSENVDELYEAIENNRVPFLKAAGFYPEWYREE